LAVGAVAGGGAATLRQFGLPVAAACASRPVVSTPTMPSTAIPAAVWNQRTAWIVFGPSVPSIAPALQPSESSWRCSDSTPAASLVLPFATAAPAGGFDAPATTPTMTSTVITARRQPRPIAPSSTSPPATYRTRAPCSDGSMAW